MNDDDDDGKKRIAFGDSHQKQTYAVNTLDTSKY
jgi:hypothetical protein